MGNSARFQYTLEPVLLQRQWDLDALKLDLGKINELLRRTAGERDELRHKSRQAAEDRRAASAASQGISVGSLTTALSYLSDLSNQIAGKERELNALEIQREALIDQLAVAQKSMEAMENHREEMRALFRKTMASIEYKSADDHWSTLHGNGIGYDH